MFYLRRASAPFTPPKTSSSSIPDFYYHVVVPDSEALAKGEKWALLHGREEVVCVGDQRYLLIGSWVPGPIKITQCDPSMAREVWVALKNSPYTMFWRRKRM